MCWEAIRAQGGVVEGGVGGVSEASEEFGVRWVAQCSGQLLDGCGVVVLLVSICVRRVLGHPLGGLFGRGYLGQGLQVAVAWGVQSHVFEPWGVAGVLVFGLRVCLRDVFGKFNAFSEVILGIFQPFSLILPA